MSALLDILHRDCDAEGARIATAADMAAARGLAPQSPTHWPQIAAHTQLYAELAYALEPGATGRLCWVPGFKDQKAHMPAADIVADSFAGKDDATLHELLTLLSAAIKSTDPKVADMGRKLLHKVCRAHADFHEGDAA